MTRTVTEEGLLPCWKEKNRTQGVGTKHYNVVRLLRDDSGEGESGGRGEVRGGLSGPSPFFPSSDYCLVPWTPFPCFVLLPLRGQEG